MPVCRRELEREGGGRERERAGERKTFLLPPLLMTEAISVARRHEEREVCGREGGEIFLLLPVKRAYARMHERRKEDGDGEERGIAREGEERERERGERERRSGEREEDKERDKEIAGERFYGRERGCGRERS